MNLKKALILLTLLCLLLMVICFTSCKNEPKPPLLSLDDDQLYELLTDMGVEFPKKKIELAKVYIEEYEQDINYVRPAPISWRFNQDVEEQLRKAVKKYYGLKPDPIEY